MPKLWEQMILRRTVLNPEAVNKPGFYLDQIIHVWMVLFLIGILTSFLFCSIFSTWNIEFFFEIFPWNKRLNVFTEGKITMIGCYSIYSVSLYLMLLPLKNRKKKRINKMKWKKIKERQNKIKLWTNFIRQYWC